jgi:predicted porin
VNVSATTIAEVDDGGGKHYSVSYKYGFSKRTYAYVFGAHVKAENGARIEGGPLGGKATALGFGLQHNF